MTEWIDLLLEQIVQKSASVVAKELGVSPTAISLVKNGKYGARTDEIERRVMSVYGGNGMVNCPVLGEIKAVKCIDNWKKAQVIRSAGNPRTIRLYATCRKCTFK